MRILVTAGPTREYFDSVRFISNPSTGKMGYAVAAEAARRGHDVVLVSGPVQLPGPEGVRVIHVVTAHEMFEAAVAHFEACKAAVMTAAVCDYRPSESLDHKLPKQPQPRTVRLEPTRDICAHVGQIKGDRVVIGFAMEDRDAHARTERKLHSKQCDAMVLNGVGCIGGDAAEVEVLHADGKWSPPIAGSKTQIAVCVVDLVEQLAGARA